jgi:type IV pilus modification protein PilV
MKTRLLSVPRGFTILEALIALLVMSFGMLALSGMQLNLSRNADVAKQRAEATRLAQDRIEQMRSFTGLTSGAINWNGLDALVNQDVTKATDYFTNTTYTVASSMGGADGDTFRTLRARVTWNDRANQAQEVNLYSVISRIDPNETGLLGNPLQNNTVLKRPKNRNINIPYPALDLSNGTSAYQFSANFVVVFSNVSASVVQICNPGTLNATESQILAASCETVNGYIVAGYLTRTSSSLTWPTGINTDSIIRNTAHATRGITCSFGDAVDQNSSVNATIADFKYYICVVPLEAPFFWDGTLRIGGARTDTNYIICRYQYTQTAVTVNERNIQPYDDVNMSLDLQNYLLTTTSATNPSSSNCPSAMTVTGVSTGVLHQNCRSNNPSVATACPASTP